MNQHERVEQLLVEHDERAQKARAVAEVLLEIERSIGLLAWHLHRTLTDREAQRELAGYLENLRRAIRNVEADL